jgi:hypothetical protein
MLALATLTVSPWKTPVGSSAVGETAGSGPAMACPTPVFTAGSRETSKTVSPIETRSRCRKIVSAGPIRRPLTNVPFLLPSS